MEMLKERLAFVVFFLFVWGFFIIFVSLFLGCFGGIFWFFFKKQLLWQSQNLMASIHLECSKGTGLPQEPQTLAAAAVCPAAATAAVAPRRSLLSPVPPYPSTLIPGSHRRNSPLILV